MIKYLLIFGFGGLGSLTRYGISSWLGNTQQGFPVGTLLANIGSCAIFGVFLAATHRYAPISSAYRFAVLTGFCGGFSTFSTFSAETLVLLEQGQWAMAALYVLSSLVLGIGAIWLLSQWQ